LRKKIRGNKQTETMQKEIIRAIIVEDEENSRENLKNLLRTNCPHVEIIAEAESIVTAIAVINKHKADIDLAFLDVNLNDGEIFMLLNILGQIDFDIIFVSAYPASAHLGYKYSALDFLPKPIDEENLKQAVDRSGTRKENKTKERLEILQNSLGSNQSMPERITISSMESFDFVYLKDIVRMEGQDNYTVLFLTSGEKVASSKTIRVYEDMLANKNFFRVHKSHIINIEHMKKFMRGEGGGVIMADGKEIEVSRRRRPLLIEFLKKLNQDFTA
jgi:two-component system, LytTR family, response regulator